ncbi:metal ABC transporter permease [Thermoactinomyces intermedius]|jgi:zinc transport system permease protein|uniref:Metal ABC transporter permease n=1 Tax=Thermoactinomyces intermedius TaxID=2024 RepID=A0A8I1A8F9_THEIN|nr:metal ABC transporter permease [Thermoactinomyces intermedius]MBA4550019.1 metal ABC transporter permease [Thermoactinomyces intermedius]MBA4835765.1 metal ABC transporter permease [Thermoactinomyces intermedius]MBH8596348.1 metal ABC transporter permease [Thermoactinomyces intermedius]
MMMEILQYEWMQNAFYAGIIIGFISPLVGVFLVVRRMSLIADALSHITLSGVAAGMLLQKELPLFYAVNPLYVGMAFAVTGSVLVEQIRRLYKSFEEIAIPILLSGGIGLGVVLISAADGFNVDIAGYLFGNILAVTREELGFMAAIGGIVVLFILIFYKEMFALAFDEEHAVLTGIPRKTLHFLFLVIVALVITASIRVVGILLVSALMTLPVAAGLQLAKSFKQALFWSVLFSELAVFSGLVSAYYLDWASGGTIVLVSLIIWLFILCFKKMTRKTGRIYYKIKGK